MLASCPFYSILSRISISPLNRSDLPLVVISKFLRINSGFNYFFLTFRNFDTKIKISCLILSRANI